MAKKPKKSKAQASPQELMEKRIGASMSARGDKILDTTIAGAGFEKGFSLDGGIFGGSSSTGEEK